MSNQSLSSQLARGKHEFTEETIEIHPSGDFIKQAHFNSFNSSNLFLNFNKCTFTGGYLEFDSIIEPHVAIRFFDCTFECELVIRDCSFFTLGFRDTIKIHSIEVTQGNFEHFYFRNNSKIPIEGNIDITSNTVLKTLKFDNLSHKGEFKLSLRNNFIKDSENPLKSTFKNSTFETVEFLDTFFGNEANFKKIEITNTIIFQNCNFNKSYFEKAKFHNLVAFKDCKFFSYFGLEKCVYINKPQVNFSACLFKSFAHFNESKFDNIHIQHTTFERKTSFDRLETNTLKFYQVTFMQSTYFDELKINEVENEYYIKSLKSNEARDLRRSIRSIKHELQKSENRIDYSRFRGYELQAYYQELNSDQKKKYDKDRLILWTTKHVTGFDYSWKKALSFTLIAALLFYTTFFALEDFDQGTRFNVNQYLIGYFRFLLVTDFYNPLSDGRNYILNDGWNHLFSWFIFILGKIVIAFGIYEMIQAFRKFKA